MPEIKETYKVVAYLGNADSQHWYGLSWDKANMIKRTLESGKTYSTDLYFLKGEFVSCVRIDKEKNYAPPEPEPERY